MINKKIKHDDLNVTIRYLEGFDTYIFIYIHSDDVFDIDIQGNYVFVFITGNDWENDFTPFKGKAVFKGGRDFLGGACEYSIKFLEIVKNIEKNLDLKIDYRILAGYSLAGLFTLYSTSKTDFFNKICCCSASLWFPGFIGYIKDNDFTFKDGYFSIGDKESNTKNAFLSKSLDMMNASIELLKNKGKNVFFEMNDGGHFKDCNDRLIKGIKYLLTH